MPSSPPTASSIGIFVSSGDVEDVSDDDAPAFIESMEGDLSTSFLDYEDLLSAEKCEKLQAFADGLDGELNGALSSDFKVEISAASLNGMIGLKDLKTLRDFYARHTNGVALNMIMLRRMEGHGQYLPLHLDDHRDILKVQLNGEDEYSGGRLVFLTKNGFEFPVSRSAGSATLFDASKIVHGVTRFEKGVRYGLFLVNDPGRPQLCSLTQEILLAGGRNETEGACTLNDVRLQKDLAVGVDPAEYSYSYESN